MMIAQQKVLEPNGGYNEVILDAASWARNMPRTIMAVFVHKGASAADVATSKRVHSDFLQEYDITDNETPLVVYDPQTGHFALFAEAAE